MKYTHYDDSGLLGIEYDLTIEFGFSPAEPGSRINPPIPAHIYDERIVAATAYIANAEPVEITNEFDLIALNNMLDPGYWTVSEPLKVAAQNFLDTVHEAIAEHLDEEDKVARESAAEAKFQAMRDGE
jgi:hypothetical protein